MEWQVLPCLFYVGTVCKHFSSSKSWQIQIVNSNALEDILNFQVVHFSRPLGFFLATTAPLLHVTLHQEVAVQVSALTKAAKVFGGCDKNRYGTQATRTKRWNWIFLALSRRRDWQGEINLIMFDKMWVLWISTTDSDDVVRGVYINSSYRGRHSNRPLVSVSLDHNNSGESLYSPLLAPSGPRRIVHSSIIPNGVNNCLTSSSVCCLLSMPTKSFRSTQ